MKTVSQSAIASEQHLIRWYSLGTDGESVDKLFTYHNYAQGWYMCLDPGWTHRISVEQDENGYNFYLWDDEIVGTIFLCSAAGEEFTDLPQTFGLAEWKKMLNEMRWK